MSEPKPRLSDADFVKACVELKDAAQVAELAGLTVESILSRARRLRHAGVNLPAFPRRVRGTDVESLNKLIENQP